GQASLPSRREGPSFVRGTPWVWQASQLAFRRFSVERRRVSCGFISRAFCLAGSSGTFVLGDVTCPHLSFSCRCCWWLASPSRPLSRDGTLPFTNRARDS